MGLIGLKFFCEIIIEDYDSFAIIEIFAATP